MMLAFFLGFLDHRDVPRWSPVKQIPATHRSGSEQPTMLPLPFRRETKIGMNFDFPQPRVFHGQIAHVPNPGGRPWPRLSGVCPLPRDNLFCRLRKGTPPHLLEERGQSAGVKTAVYGKEPVLPVYAGRPQPLELGQIWDWDDNRSC